MKKLSQGVLIVLLFFALTPTQLSASPVSGLAHTTTSATPVSADKTEAMENRLREIKAMDRSRLSTSEKRALRKEVKSIKDSVKSSGNGVYLSVGAIIIIILLLILLV